MIGRQGIHDADEFSCFEVLDVIAFLEMIQFLQHRDRNRHIVLGKVHDGVVCVKDHGSVQHKDFPIFIGLHEAWAIDRAVKGVTTPRPLTHDLISNIIEGLNAGIVRILISDLRNNTFYAKIILQQDGSTVEIDSRPSDAIALAMQKNTPIKKKKKVLEEVCKAESEF